MIDSRTFDGRIQLFEYFRESWPDPLAPTRMTPKHARLRGGVTGHEEARR
jgi:hypothetical protein